MMFINLLLKILFFLLTHKIEKLALIGLNGKGRGLADAYIFFTEKWLGKNKPFETKIFNKPDEALDWLGIKMS